MYVKHIILLLILTTIGDCRYDCIHRDYKHGSTVCVCNATYCDTIDPVDPLAEGKFVSYSSNRDGLRFHTANGNISEIQLDSEIYINIDSGTKYQKILGWGGAFTDSAGYNIQSLNAKAKNNLLRSFFSKEGIEYSLCRVTIGFTDLSMRYYSYDEVDGDTNLTHFNLTIEDHKYKIPLILEALKLTNNTLKLFASSWTPPTWMKTDNSTESGSLKKEYYQTWVDYHIKFFDAYKKEGILFWGLTTGNEPLVGFAPFFGIPALAWLPWEQGDWIANNLGPTIRNHPEYSKMKIITYDDQRIFMPFVLLLETFSNNSTKYFDGIGVHWYTDQFFPFFLRLTHYLFPNKFILGTEGCTGDKRYKKKQALGSWHRGEHYVQDIIEDMDNWVAGWVEWNIALNLRGGPAMNDAFMDSTIIVNASAQEFYKNPTFYAIGHFSKFVPSGSVKIYSDVNTEGIKVVAFLRPDKGVATIIFNRHNYNKSVSIFDENRGYININITERSINTILYW